jgi:hypothetical protein
MGIERSGVSVLAAAVEDIVSEVGTVIATELQSLMEGRVVDFTNSS